MTELTFLTRRRAAAAAAWGVDSGVELGVLRGSPETLVENGAAKLFFPLGIGHLVGLGIRDTGPASHEGREPTPGQPRLRVDIPLGRRQAWTVEPGIYVVPALLERERGRDDVDWDRVRSDRGCKRPLEPRRRTRSSGAAGFTTA